MTSFELHQPKHLIVDLNQTLAEQIVALYGDVYWYNPLTMRFVHLSLIEPAAVGSQMLQGQELDLPAFLYGEAYQKLPDHEWFKQRHEAQTKEGEVGTHHAMLKKHAYAYQGKTRDFFIRATQRKEFAEYRMKYAANVPHLMLYPEGGCVDYASVKTVKVAQTAVYGSSKWVPKHAL